MRCIFIPHLGKIGLAYFSPSEREVAHTSRGIDGGSNQRARLGGGGVMGWLRIPATLGGLVLAGFSRSWLDLKSSSGRGSFSEHFHPL
jgi:hypothetical protein